VVVKKHFINAAYVPCIHSICRWRNRSDY
jgi:hypothetical protein